MAEPGQGFLFGAEAAGIPAAGPLAERMRPRSVDEVAGHAKVLAPDSFLGRMLRGQSPPRSLVLWGPPGCGKTTIARLFRSLRGFELVSLSAVLDGVKDLRQRLEEARDRRRREGRGTILFVDEIHRFNKAQQDAFLAHVERGDIVLVGATTENPSFEINAPLLSRCRVVLLEALADDDVAAILDRAMADRQRGLGTREMTLAGQARAFLAGAACGDSRAALAALEIAADLAGADGRSSIEKTDVEEAMQRRALRYDAGGDEHYNVVSAFIKSMRAGDADATLYWLARMVEAGEDPVFVARRMVIFASEDVGLADDAALPLAMAAADAVRMVGLPEGRIVLAHAAVRLALAPKSNRTYTAVESALEEVRRSGPLPVPLHLRNAPTRLLRDLGYGKGYVYPHDAPVGHDPQACLPEAIADRRFLPNAARPHEAAGAGTERPDAAATASGRGSRRERT